MSDPERALGGAGRASRSMATLAPGTLAAIKATIFVICLGPLARLVVGGFLGKLGVNPVELITRSTGTWTLVFILVTLAVTPLRQLSGWHWLARLRRLFGLYAFFYGVMHFLTFVWLEHFFDPSAIARDIVKRPFVTMGFTALVMMVPLAITSTDAMVRRLGGRRWVALHRLIYPLAACGVIHYWWLVKRDVTQPVIYGGVLGVLIGYRLWRVLRNRASAR